MSELFSLILVFSTIRLTTPLLLAALGGMFSERAGVINIALEGLMLSGAFTAAAVTATTGSVLLGVLVGVVAGVALAAVHAVACIQFKADQVVSGTAINILMLGLPQLLSGAFFLSTGSTPQIPQENLLPTLNTFFGTQALDISVMSILAFALVPIGWYVLFRTPFGLRLRAVGENPAAADAAGVSVNKMRYTAVLISGALAALGGAYLSIGQSSLFTRNMTAGRGFIALAALIFGKWKPVPTMLACLLFGFTEALTNQVQGVFKLPSGEDIPVQFIQIIPYVLTIIVLAGFIGHSRAPKALGQPYEKQ
ncbi:MAG TPA: ABC transporter permease [Pyrinomonadaceae bacterium]|jgi:simple sugar transport system permease protein